MNLILLDSLDTRHTLCRGDRRSQHLEQILRPPPGSSFDVGFPEGPRGKARLVKRDTVGNWHLEVEWGSLPPLPEPMELIVGLPRPQTARKILNTATSMGYRSLHFFPAEKGESGYIKSRLWATDEWLRHCHEGAEQAFTTRIPVVTHHASLVHCLEDPALAFDASRIALDLYEAESSILAGAPWRAPVIAAIGPERGWSHQERNLLRTRGFRLVHLGERVLRVETACAVLMGCLLMGCKND